MAGTDVEDVARLCPSAGLDETIGRRHQLSQDVVGHQALDTDVILFEILLSLRLGQSAGRMGQNFFRFHLRVPRCVPTWTTPYRGYPPAGKRR